MPMWAAFWAGDDIEDRGVTDTSTTPAPRRSRPRER
jgi:hypothetical protein